MDDLHAAAVVYHRTWTEGRNLERALTLNARLSQPIDLRAALGYAGHVRTRENEIWAVIEALVPDRRLNPGVDP